MYSISPKWCELPSVEPEKHDKKYLNILAQYSFDDLPIPIPLVGRYSKGRRWVPGEVETCYEAWKSGVSLTKLAAYLNRNPQDMIYKLLARCKRDGIDFTQKHRSEGSSNWTNEVECCAANLFDAGLPAWKIAVIFQVDFEHVEKSLFVKRKDYGHNKKNPFSICTDHKQLVNFKIATSLNGKVSTVLEAFAGEGRFTKILEQIASIKTIVAIEKDGDTFARANSRCWGRNISWIKDDNMNYFRIARQEEKKFDLIDLDPFVTCHKQLEFVWDLLNREAYLFVTFGGEYRRSFIKSNRKSISKRYGFFNIGLNNQEYLELVPHYFLGYVAEKAAQYNFTFEILRSVRYANNCRFWLKVYKMDGPETLRWLSDNTITKYGGRKFLDLEIPRFRDVRKEIDDAKKKGFYL